MAGFVALPTMLRHLSGTLPQLETTLNAAVSVKSRLTPVLFVRGHCCLETCAASIA